LVLYGYFSCIYLGSGWPIFFVKKISLPLPFESNFIDESHIAIYCAEFTISALIWFFVLRKILEWGDILKTKITKRTGSARAARTDIRSIGTQLPDAKKVYKPEKYFKKNQVFIGLNDKNKPVYIPISRWRSSHVDVIGTTGSGKGVAAGVLLTQAVQQGESVFVIDPKNDEYLPSVMRLAAERAGVPFVFIDLLSSVPQWNPFANKTQFEIEELIASGFGLADNGTDADFHRLRDRASARVFAQNACGKQLRLVDVISHCMQAHAAVLAESEKFVANMQEIAAMPVVGIQRGLDISKSIMQGSVVYVKGAIRNLSVLILQKMFVLSVMQYCENRKRNGARHVCIFMDEFKYLISKPALEALGAIRDKGAHVVLAHQSLGDLRSCPKDIDPDSVVSSINENCSLKLTYKVNDPATADWLARISGQILVDDEVRSFTANNALVEMNDPIRQLRQTERCLMDTNMLQSLPPRCAVLYGNGLAQFIFTSPIKVEKSDDDTLPTIFEDAPTSAQSVVNPSSYPNKVTSLAEELINVD